MHVKKIHQGRAQYLRPIVPETLRVRPTGRPQWKLFLTDGELLLYASNGEWQFHDCALIYAGTMRIM